MKPRENTLRFLVLLAACALVSLPVHAQVSVVSGSHYHPRFEGRPMACGGRYDADEYTAASNRHPCDALVKVTRRGQSVLVRVTDRCGRCGIDLSTAAAREIGLHRLGRASVAVERLQ